MASTGSGGPANAVEKKEEAEPPTEPHVQKPPPPARKEPPPEKPADVRRRSWVILSFWLVVVCLGLPIWWRTTAIYRASLPLEKMLQWADNKACRPVVPLQISILAPAGMPEHEASGLLRLTQHALDDLSDFDGHHLRLQLAPRERAAGLSAENARGAKGEEEEDGDIALRIRLAPGDANAAAMDPHAPVLNISYAPNSVPSSTATWSPLSSYIANQLREIFAEEVGVITYLLSTAAVGASGTASTTITTTTNTRIPGLTPDAFAAIARRTTRTLRYAATYHLTFSLFTAGAVPNTWDVEAAIAEYVRPVLDVLSPIHNFTIDTQIQLYAGPGTQAQVLSKDDLASFINAAEWPLSPSIGGAPTINFVLFVGNQTIGLAEEGREDDGEAAAPPPPPPSSSSSQSWLIPQWGTVYLLPPPGPDGASHLPADALKQPMLTFAGHLLSLLGTPRSGTVPMRLATLARIRSTDLFLRASSTLGSLARLAKALPSISIPSSVADGTAATMARLELACKSLGKPEGLRHARVADEEAERAFFEKSMVGQLYFPDEHKIAVYLPLLGPVGVPLIIGLLNEIRGWRKRRRQRAEDGAAKKLQ